MANTDLCCSVTLNEEHHAQHSSLREQQPQQLPSPVAMVACLLEIENYHVQGILDISSITLGLNPKPEGKQGH